MRCDAARLGQDLAALHIITLHAAKKRANIVTCATFVWLSAPALVEQVLQADADTMHKSLVEKRTFDIAMAGSVLITEGQDWRWQRRALAPLFRPVDLQAHVPMMAAAQVSRWRDGKSPVRAIDKDMTRATYEVILATMLVGGPAEAVADGGLQFEFADVTPRVVTADGPAALTVDGTLTNEGSTPITGVGRMFVSPVWL